MKILSRLKIFSEYILPAAAIFIFGINAGAEVDISDGCLREYQVRDLEEQSGWGLKLTSQREDKVWLSNLIYPAGLDGDTVYILERKERTKQGHRDQWKFFMEQEMLGLIRIEKRTISNSGKTVRETWVDYRDTMFDYPANLCHINTIAQAVRVMDLTVGARNDFYLLLSLDSSPWHMFMIVEGVEKITVPAGTFECYRLRLEPDYKEILGSWSWSSRLFKPFVPEYNFWVEKHGSHNLIYFTGGFGPVGAAPTQAHELIKVDCSQKGKINIERK